MGEPYSFRDVCGPAAGHRRPGTNRPGLADRGPAAGGGLPGGPGAV